MSQADVQSDEQVWVIAKRETYHLDRDCPKLETTHRDPVPKARSQIPHRRCCSVCDGTAQSGSNQPAGDEAPPHTDAVRDALERKGLLSRRDLEFEAHLSESQVQRALRYLKSADEVQIEDRYSGTPLYTLVEGDDGPDRAALERRRAAEHSLRDVTGHVQDQWPDRSLAGFEDLNLEDVWDDAQPIHYPSARNGAVARYYRRTDTVLLARQGGLVTCIDLMDRPWSERIYIRNQVIEQ